MTVSSINKMAIHVFQVHFSPLRWIGVVILVVYGVGFFLYLKNKVSFEEADLIELQPTKGQKKWGGRSSPYSKGSTKGYEGGGEESDEEESDDNDGLWHSVRKNNIQVFHFPYLDQAMANADKGVIEAYIDRRSPFLKYFSLVLGFLLILGTGIELRRGGLRRLALDRGHRRRAAAAYARALSHTEEEEEEEGRRRRRRRRRGPAWTAYVSNSEDYFPVDDEDFLASTVEPIDLEDFQKLIFNHFDEKNARSLLDGDTEDWETPSTQNRTETETQSTHSSGTFSFFSLAQFRAAIGGRPKASGASPTAKAAAEGEPGGGHGPPPSGEQTHHRRPGKGEEEEVSQPGGQGNKGAAAAEVPAGAGAWKATARRAGGEGGAGPGGGGRVYDRLLPGQALRPGDALRLVCEGRAAAAAPAAAAGAEGGGGGGGACAGGGALALGVSEEGELVLRRAPADAASGGGVAGGGGGGVEGWGEVLWRSGSSRRRQSALGRLLVGLGGSGGRGGSGSGSGGGGAEGPRLFLDPVAAVARLEDGAGRGLWRSRRPRGGAQQGGGGGGKGGGQRGGGGGGGRWCGGEEGKEGGGCALVLLPSTGSPAVVRGDGEVLATFF